MKRTQMWDLARAVVDHSGCSVCQAAVGERCVSLRSLGAKTHLRGISDREEIPVPHAERYPGGNRRISDPANRALLEGSGV